MVQVDSDPRIRVLRFEQNRRIFRFGAILLLLIAVCIEWATRSQGAALAGGVVAPLIILFLGHSHQIVLDGKRRELRHRWGLFLPFVTGSTQDLGGFNRVWIRIVDKGGVDWNDYWFGIGLSGQMRDLGLAIRRKHARALEIGAEIATLVGVGLQDESGGVLPR